MSLLNFQGLIDKITSYFELKIENAKEDIRNEVAKALAKIIFVCFIFYVASFGVVFLLIAVANLLNLYFENSYAGFLIVGGIAVAKAVAFALLSKKKNFIKKIEEQILRAVRKENQEKETKEKTNP